MKSPHRTHHSRIEPSSASIKQHSESYTLTVKFYFNPWDSPREYPAAYAGDAFATFQHIWDTGIDALQKGEDAATIDALRGESND